MFVSSRLPSQPGMLESALDSTLNQHHYNGQSDPFQLAANLAYKIMKNHAYQDGNKRTSLLAASIFLQLNGKHMETERIQPQALAEAQVACCTDGWSIERLGKYYEDLSNNT